MPGRNIYKTYVSEAHYHAYNRGVNKEPIFRDDEDYRVFLNLFKKLLSPELEKDKYGRSTSNMFGKIELLSYCLMPNHFHILVYQHSPEAITSFLKSISISYSMYFNKKYKRVGPLFQSRYRASMISNEEYFRYIPDYIHVNPKNFLEWKYSSLPFYLGEKSASWISTDRSGCQLDRKLYIEHLKELSESKLLNKKMRRILELDASY